MFISNSLAARLREERGNCFLYGCVTLTLLAMLGGLIVFLVSRNLVREVREKYTEAAPIDLPTVDMPADQIEALIERVDTYARDLRDGKPLPALTLTENEINALLQNHPELREVYGGLMHASLEDGGVTSQMSLPLDWLPGMRGRYFNGTATFDVKFANSDLDVLLRSATVKGELVPEQYLDPVRTEDFASEWERRSDARTLLEKLASVKVEKAGVTFTPKNLATSETPAPVTAPEAEAPPSPQPEADPA